MVSGQKNNQMYHVTKQGNYHPKTTVPQKEMDNNQQSHKRHHDPTVHHKGDDKGLHKKFIFSLILTVPVLILSSLIQSFLGITFTFLGRSYILLAFATLIFFYGGWPADCGTYIRSSEPLLCSRQEYMPKGIFENKIGKVGDVKDWYTIREGE